MNRDVRISVRCSENKARRRRSDALQRICLEGVAPATPNL